MYQQDRIFEYRIHYITIQLTQTRLYFIKLFQKIADEYFALDLGTKVSPG